jgi:gamma-glutamyltranspeptidase/glutathione hydrolase
MTLEDLALHESVLVEPISYTYGEEQLTVHECPPNGQGLAALIALGILDVLREDGVLNLRDYEEGSAEWLHALM